MFDLFRGRDVLNRPHVTNAAFVLTKSECTFMEHKTLGIHPTHAARLINTVPSRCVAISRRKSLLVQGRPVQKVSVRRPSSTCSKWGAVVDFAAEEMTLLR